MTTYLLGEITKSHESPDYIPVGIVAREGSQFSQVRVVSSDQIPSRYRPVTGIGAMMLENLEPTLSGATKPNSGALTNIRFVNIVDVNETGTLADRATKLFNIHVKPHYNNSTQ